MKIHSAGWVDRSWSKDMKIKRLKAVRLVATVAAVIGLSATLVAPASALGVPGQWVAVGGPPGGSITSVAPSPIYKFDSTVFVSTFSAGVFRSNDGGGSFARLNNGLTNLQVNHIAVSPKIWIDGTIFAGTTTGMFMTTDSGMNWSAVGGGLPSGDVKGIALSAQFEKDPHSVRSGPWAWDLPIAGCRGDVGEAGIRRYGRLGRLGSERVPGEPEFGLRMDEDGNIQKRPCRERLGPGDHRAAAWLEYGVSRRLFRA